MSRFLVPYAQYVAQRTDAPVEFGHAAGLMCLSGVAIGRRWLSNGLHPNLFMLLVGPSSRDRKSTSINLGMEILEDVEPQRMGPGDFTMEGLLNQMRTTKDSDPEKSRCVIPIPEFGTYLAQGKKSYMIGGSTLLCQLYDGDTVIRARAKDQIVVKNPRVCVIGGCAHGMLEKYVETVDWEGGFFARMMFVLGKTKLADFSAKPPENPSARDAVRAALRDLSNELKAFPGVHPMDMAAMHAYDTYVRSIPDRTGDPATVAQRERLLNTISKLALLYQIDDNPSSPIGLQAMTNAIAFSMHCWESFKYAYGLSSGTYLNKLARKLWREISDGEEAGPGSRKIRRRDLMRKFHMNLTDVVPLIKTLKDAGLVAELIAPDRYGRDQPLYWAKVEYVEQNHDHPESDNDPDDQH